MALVTRTAPVGARLKPTSATTTPKVQQVVSPPPTTGPETITREQVAEAMSAAYAKLSRQR